MITDMQVRGLRALLIQGETLSRAAWKTGMDRKTASSHQTGPLPSERVREHDWKTREDPFHEVWDEVKEQLEDQPRLKAKVLFQWLQRKHPGKFQDGQLRTFQRGIKRWRATAGPPKEVFFSQTHKPGRLGASDFTCMNELNVTIQGQRFDHLAYHFVLTYSNWEWATVCFSESFESLSDGLQAALWQLGAAPERHRSDRMSAAVNNLSNPREFTQRYKSLTKHYEMTMEKTNPDSGNENGDVESLNRHFKEVVDQTLLLRGSRDFASRDEYESLLREVVVAKNAGRTERLKEELLHMHPLPSLRLESFKKIRARVGLGSLIRVQKNVYSVQSQLIGEHVSIRIHAEHLEVWYAQKCVDRLPRLRGGKRHHINYRHVIDTLIRKPGAFENYRYKDDLFPTSRFRMAYDQLCKRHASTVASREYLTILELAARENESAVDDILRLLLDQSDVIDSQQVKERLALGEPIRPATEVAVEEPDLVDFDCLLDNKEVLNACEQGCEEHAEWTSTGAASADVP